VVRLDRIYPGLSKVWVATDFTNAQVRRYLEATGYNLKCSFCGKPWHEVQRIITRKDDQVGICDCCVREFIETMKDVPPEVPLPRAAAPDAAVVLRSWLESSVSSGGMPSHRSHPGSSAECPLFSGNAPMSMCPDFWNVLHDGTVVAVAGRVPGDLRIDVEADYLRSRFTDHGSRFVITLQDCRTFEFHRWPAPGQPVTDLHEIAALQLWILSADVAENVCIVHCTQGDNGGTLRVSARDAALALDSGRVLTLEEISSVANAYWAEFASRKPYE